MATTHRRYLHRSFGIHELGMRVTAAANVQIDRISHFDVYSCFPSAVMIAAQELGIDGYTTHRSSDAHSRPVQSRTEAAGEARSQESPHGEAERVSKHKLHTKRRRPLLTQTGGLPYHGGPGNNYATHSIAAMVQTLRRASHGDSAASHSDSDGDSAPFRSKVQHFGLVTAVGGLLTKHSAAIYSTTPYSVTHPSSTTTPLCWCREGQEGSVQARRREWELGAEARSMEVSAIPTGTGRAEIFTVEYISDSSSPTGGKAVRAIFIGTMLDGADKGKRFLAFNDTPEVMDFMVDSARSQTATGSFGVDGEVRPGAGAAAVFTPVVGSRRARL